MQCVFSFVCLQLHSALNNREEVLIARLVGLYHHKVSILMGQRDRLQQNQTCLENALQRAKTSIQSPSDVEFLLSRQAIVSTLETKESYSMVLEPEAQFLPEFTKPDNSKEEKKSRQVRMIRIYQI